MTKVRQILFYTYIHLYIFVINTFIRCTDALIMNAMIIQMQ